MRDQGQAPADDVFATLERVRRDFWHTGLSEISLVLDPDYRTSTGSAQWNATSQTRGDLTLAHLEDNLADVVVIAGGHRFPARLELGLEQACANMCSVLQDDVMDVRGAPWPELTRDGHSGVLEPALNGEGTAVWQLRGKPFCVVGELAGALDTAGRSDL